MDVLFSIIPGHGHFFPCIPLARALREAGHSVLFATASSYGETIRSQGFETVAAGLDYTQGSIAEGAADEAGIEGAVEQKMFVEGPPAMVESVGEIVGRRRPDVILADPVEFGSQVAAELAGVPWGAVVFGIRTVGSFPGFLPFEQADRTRFIAEHTMRGQMRRLREQFGLGEADLLVGEMGYDRTLALCMAPPSLEAWPLEWISHTAHPLRPHTHSSESDDGWLIELPRDRPIVAVSFGTLFGTPELESTAAEAALAAGARVVVATRRHLDLRHDRLHVVPWVSMDNLMETADLLVHHGGWGSTVAAMASGTPAVVAPLGADQAVQGARLMSVGAARTLGPKRTVESFRGEIERVLEDPVYLNSARRLRAEIEAMPSAGDVVPLVEQLAETGGPVLNR